MNECAHDEPDIILCNYRIYSERKDSYEERINRIGREKNFFRAWLRNRLKSNIWSCLYRNEFIRSKGLKYHQGCISGEDEEFFLKTLTAAEKISVSKTILYTYTYYVRQASLRPLQDSLNAKCRTASYIRKHKHNQHTLANYYLIWGIVRAFTLYAKRRDKSSYEKYLRMLKHKKIRSLLLSSAKSILLRPETFFKAMMLLYFPRLYYKLRS